MHFTRRLHGGSDVDRDCEHARCANAKGEGRQQAGFDKDPDEG